MTDDAAPCRTLAEYVAALFAELDAADPVAGTVVRRLAGPRRARIQLDDEAVDAWFGEAGRLEVAEAAGYVDVDGDGTTDRETVLDLLDGRIEVSEAILDGRLDVVGELDVVTRMFEIIEILLAGSAHIPALQDLARDFRSDPCRPRRSAAKPGSEASRWYPPEPDPVEMELLARLDALP